MPSTAVLRGALSQFVKQHGKKIMVTYVQVPIGIIVILLLSVLVDTAMRHLPFTFPSSTVMMIIMFLVMITLHRFSPERGSKWFDKFFAAPAEWVLGNMGLFFTSSFILIPSRAPMAGKDIGLLVAIFVPAFIITWVGTVGLCKAWDYCARYSKQNRRAPGDADKLPDPEVGSVAEALAPNLRHDIQFDTSAAVESPIDPPALEIKKEATQQSSKLTTNSDDDDLQKIQMKTKTDMMVNHPQTLDDQQSAEDVIVRRMDALFDPFVYLVIFIVGIPLFFTPGGVNRSLPLFLGTVSLAWIFSRRVVPRKWQMILHPILISSSITITAIWIFGAIKGISLRDLLGYYSTGGTYLVLIRQGSSYAGRPPSAGDVMSSILAAGIVSLAFPLFRYRQDLISNCSRILLVVIPNCVVSLFLWPYLAKLMGLSGSTAAAFAGRFMSTPFGIELMIAIKGGDKSLVVVLICITGILAVIVRDHFFRLLRVRVTAGSDDYFTMGVTIGVIAAAIGTSSLLQDNHTRAAATASVTFVVYGMILLSLAAVPQVAEYVAGLAGI